MPSKKSTTLLLDRDPAELKLTYAGNVVKLLGVQMYAGRPVPAIAELVSNAWDADATKVDINLPLDEPWSPEKSGQIISVADNGIGMNWDMVRDAYLDVGRARREVEKTDKSPGGRLLQGRKGVGKLAGFGIAENVEIQTVHKENDPALGERVLIWFRLSLPDLQKVAKGPAPVELLYAGPVSRAPAGARKSKGTTVTLARLPEKQAQIAARFRQSMAQRFLVIGPHFRVRVNGHELRDEEINLQWRWPKTGWQTDEVPGCGPVKYWIGFTPEPRRQNEGDLSGVLIYTRHKISQEATFFDISGGVTGQHGLRYLVGKVKVEWVDAGLDAPDLIATHRGSIAWESPEGAALQKWGQTLLKKRLAEWAKQRGKLREQKLTKSYPELRSRIQKLAPSYRDIALRFIGQFKSIEMEPEEFHDIFSWFLDALENATLRSILQKLRETDTADLDKLDDLFSKMEIRTAVTLLQIVESNLAAIETLEKMHKTNAKERGVLSKHLENNPWLIDLTWMLNKAEGRVSTWIQNEFKVKVARSDGDDDRVDFFCVGVSGTLHIVEIKRGAHVAGDAELIQANKYVEYVTTRFAEMNDAKSLKYGRVQAHLIAARLAPGAKKIAEAFADKGWVFFTTWDDLIERAKLSHHQYREILQNKADEKAEEQSDVSSAGSKQKGKTARMRFPRH